MSVAGSEEDIPRGDGAPQPVGPSDYDGQAVAGMLNVQEIRRYEAGCAAASGAATTDAAEIDGGASQAAADDHAAADILLPTVDASEDTAGYYYASKCAARSFDDGAFPENGLPARYVKNIVEDYHLLDTRERLNTSSYVNVTFEPEEADCLLLGAKVNVADSTVYPQSVKMQEDVLRMLADLWHCPPQPPTKDGMTPTTIAGTGTVGSTEACLLAGIAMKKRWRIWYDEEWIPSQLDKTPAPQGRPEAEHGHPQSSMLPNIVISSLYQAAWEKFFKYMDVEPRFVQPSVKTFAMEPDENVAALIDERTIGVVCILGNHYSGHYDPVWKMDSLLAEMNQRTGYKVGIHVDGASGAFIAPFQAGMEAWDFRLPHVLSISASGHKFGEAVCGTGWLLWRQKEGLAEYVATSVTYLGGKSDSYTLNFSRPASATYSQFYKFMRLGRTGYHQLTDNRMEIAKFIRQGLRQMKYQRTDEGPSRARFLILDGGDSHCLPVVAAMLNPKLHLKYNDIDLQHVISESNWYVSGYTLGFADPRMKSTKATNLLCDMGSEQTMFRIVVKSTLTLTLAKNLLRVIARSCEWLDENFNPNATVIKIEKHDVGHGAC